MKNEIHKAVDDVADTVDEAKHRSEAEGERATREVAGDAMTPGEKVASVFNEAKHGAQAEIDRAKRELRDKT